MKTWNSQNAKTADFNSVVQKKCNRCQQRKEFSVMNACQCNKKELENLDKLRGTKPRCKNMLEQVSNEMRWEDIDRACERMISHWPDMQKTHLRMYYNNMGMGREWISKDEHLVSFT